MAMKVTNNPAFTIKKYRKGHDLETAQEIPPYGFQAEYKMIDPETRAEKMEKLPVYPSSGWVHLAMAREYMLRKLDEMKGVQHCKCLVTWPDGSKNWVTVDAGGWEKVW
jgi:hypothetical protein